MSEFKEYDPVTGLVEEYSYDELENRAVIRTTQDVGPTLDYTRHMANDRVTDIGVKKGFWLYCKIPPIVQIELHQKGIRLGNPAHTKRLIEEINTNYPHLKTTQKAHGGKVKEIYLP